MHIDWASLATIGVVAAAAATTVVLLVAFALVGLSTGSGRRVNGPDNGEVSAAHSASGAALSAVCLLAAGLIVCYGVFLIVA